MQLRPDSKSRALHKLPVLSSPSSLSRPRKRTRGTPVVERIDERMPCFGGCGGGDGGEAFGASSCRDTLTHVPLIEAVSPASMSEEA